MTYHNNGDASLESLLTRVGNSRDKIAFEALFKTFAPRVHGLSMRILKNEQAAREIVQDTMLIVWQKAPMFDLDKGNASTWIFTIARNRCFDQLRRTRGEPETVCADDIWPLADDSEPVDTDVLERDRLQRHLEQLPEAQQQVIQCLFVQGRSQTETAAHLNIPLGTVKSRLRLAMGRLRKEAQHLQ